jgi:hypothetical protein
MSRMTTCLGTPSGAAPSRPWMIKSVRGCIAGVPNTLPLHGLNQTVELGRVGCLVPNRLGSRQKSSQSLVHKTGLYNTWESQGQTERREIEWVLGVPAFRVFCGDSGNRIEILPT